MRIAVVVTVIVVAATGCTTSRAVRAWHAGIAAEDAGQLTKARRKYAESYGRNSAHAGAELARLRLLATVPESRKKAEESLKELLEKKSDRAEVLLFASWWALLEGDVKVAQTRLDAISISPVHPKHAELTLHKARLSETLNGQRRRHAAKLDPLGTAARFNASRAVVALRQGDFSRARDLLAGIVATNEQPHWTVHFNLAIAYLRLGEYERAKRLLRRAKSGCESGCAAIETNLAAFDP